MRSYVFFMLFLETGMLGAFVSLNLFLFYVFWELMLVPMYFIIGIWGGPRRIYAAVKFFLFTMVGSLLMLVAILVVYYLHFQQTGVLTLDLVAPPGGGATGLLDTVIPTARRLVADAVLALRGLRARLRDQGADGAAPHLAARRARRGADGRLGDPGRRAAQDGHLRLPALRAAALPGGGRRVDARRSSALALIGIIYGALVAMVQADIKKLVAYSSVAHLGFVMLGMFALNVQGLAGACSRW